MASKQKKTERYLLISNILFFIINVEKEVLKILRKHKKLILKNLYLLLKKNFWLNTDNL